MVHTDMEIQKKRLFTNVAKVIVDAHSIYFTAFTLYLVIAFLKTTMITDYLSVHLLNYGAYLSMGILAFKWLFFSRFTKRQLIFEAIVLIFAGLSWIKSGDPLGFYMAAFVITARGQDFKELIKWYVILTTIMLVLTVVLAEINVIRNLSYLRAAHVRYAFGVVYPTDFASHVFYLMLAYCYLWFHSLNYQNYLGLLVVAGLLYYFANARLDTILILVIIPVMIVARKKQYTNFDREGLLNYSWMFTGVSAYLAIVAAIFYSPNGLLSLLNRLLSSRLVLSHTGFTKYGVSLIGQKVKEYGWGGAQGFKNFNVGGQLHQYFMLDSSFIRLLLIYGVVFFLITVGAASYAGLRALKVDNFALVAIFLLVALSCLIDQHMLELAYNPFYLAIYASIESGSQLKKRVGLKS